MGIIAVIFLYSILLAVCANEKQVHATIRQRIQLIFFIKNLLGSAKDKQV
jgi:hypothetical protein